MNPPTSIHKEEEAWKFSIHMEDLASRKPTANNKEDKNNQEAGEGSRKDF